MIHKLIQEIFHTNDFTITKMDKGLTNDNYLLTVQKEQYVIRVPIKDSEHIVNRKHEKLVMERAHLLDVDVVYFNEESGIKITKLIEHVQEYAECDKEDKIERCAQLMKQLHALPNVDFHFNPFATLATYQAHVKKPIYDLSEFDVLLDKVRRFNNPQVLCHNDFVSGNILYGKERDYLIDYEYAGSNDPLFDVTSFLSENQIFDEALRERFYQAYFNKLDKQTRQQLYLWEIFQNVLWCNWAMMMYESRHENVYQAIAKDKYDALMMTKQALQDT